MGQVVVVTGGSAGVGRAAAEEFAKRGCDLALLARGQERLDIAAEALRRYGVRVLPIPTDMGDAQAVESAADRIEEELGPIEVWVNNAMCTAFAPVADLTAEEFERGTRSTYLGTVHGTMAAMRRMRRRNRGTLVNVGSALSYRAIPLQSIYCGAKYAIRGFTDSLRCEVLHDRLNIHVTMVHLAAMNTPQFDWALNKMENRPQPVPPIFQPEVAGRAIAFAAFHRRREIWVGFPTVKVIFANKIAPGFLDWYLSWKGYSGQLTDEKRPADQENNLFGPAPGEWQAHGRFDSRAKDSSWEMFTSYHRYALTAGALLVGLAGLRGLLGGGGGRQETRLRALGREAAGRMEEAPSAVRSAGRELSRQAEGLSRRMRRW